MLNKESGTGHLKINTNPESNKAPALIWILNTFVTRRAELIKDFNNMAFFNELLLLAYMDTLSEPTVSLRISIGSNQSNKDRTLTRLKDLQSYGYVQCIPYMYRTFYGNTSKTNNTFAYSITAKGRKILSKYFDV